MARKAEIQLSLEEGEWFFRGKNVLELKNLLYFLKWFYIINNGRNCGGRCRAVILVHGTFELLNVPCWSVERSY